MYSYDSYDSDGSEEQNEDEYNSEYDESSEDDRFGIANVTSQKERAKEKVKATPSDTSATSKIPDDGTGVLSTQKGGVLLNVYDVKAVVKPKAKPQGGIRWSLPTQRGKTGKTKQLENVHIGSHSALRAAARDKSDGSKARSKTPVEVMPCNRPASPKNKRSPSPTKNLASIAIAGIMPCQRPPSPKTPKKPQERKARQSPHRSINRVQSMPCMQRPPKRLIRRFSTKHWKEGLRTHEEMKQTATKVKSGPDSAKPVCMPCQSRPHAAAVQVTEETTLAAVAGRPLEHVGLESKNEDSIRYRPKSPRFMRRTGTQTERPGQGAIGLRPQLSPGAKPSRRERRPADTSSEEL